MYRFCLGDHVSCTGYIRPTHSYYEITKKPSLTCVYHGKEEDVEVEDIHSCDRFITISCKEFTGIYVGTTVLCTRLIASHESSPAGDFFRTYNDSPEQFAVVYYSNNKKRIIPLDRISPKE